jgi:hypothetical protein
MTACDALVILIAALGRNGRSNPNVYRTSTFTAHPGAFEPAPPLQEDGALVPGGAPGQLVVTVRQPAVPEQAPLST